MVNLFDDLLPDSSSSSSGSEPQSSDEDDADEETKAEKAKMKAEMTAIARVSRFPSARALQDGETLGDRLCEYALCIRQWDVRTTRILEYVFAALSNTAGFPDPEPTDDALQLKDVLLRLRVLHFERAFSGQFSSLEAVCRLTTNVGYVGYRAETYAALAAKHQKTDGVASPGEGQIMAPGAANRIAENAEDLKARRESVIGETQRRGGPLLTSYKLKEVQAITSWGYGTAGERAIPPAGE